MYEIIFHLNYVKGFVFQVNRLKKKNVWIILKPVTSPEA